MVTMYIPRMTAQIRAFRRHYDQGATVREFCKDSDDLAILVTKYGEGELAEANPVRYATFDELGHSEQPSSSVLGLLVLIKALVKASAIMLLVVGGLLNKLQEALELDATV